MANTGRHSTRPALAHAVASMTIYFDSYTMGESFEAVNPARFDR